MKYFSPRGYLVFTDHSLWPISLIRPAPLDQDLPRDGCQNGDEVLTIMIAGQNTRPSYLQIYLYLLCALDSILYGILDTISKMCLLFTSCQINISPKIDQIGFDYQEIQLRKGQIPFKY